MDAAPFAFHMSERTARKLLRDPLLPSNPSFEDVRAALARLDAQEAANDQAK